MIFKNRQEAGKQLAGGLSLYKDGKDTVVLGIPRGGVVVAAAVAKELGAPLDIVVARKIGAPGHAELAIGAVDSTGQVFLNEELVARLGVGADYLEKVKKEEKREARRREEVFRAGRPPLSLTNKVVIVVDDGIATGATATAALRSVKAQNPRRLILAVPVAPPETVAALRGEVDELVVLAVPSDFAAVGHFYEAFPQVSDEEVVALLNPEGLKLIWNPIVW